MSKKEPSLLLNVPRKHVLKGISQLDPIIGKRFITLKIVLPRNTEKFTAEEFI